MAKVTGLGGIFFKCENPYMVRQWYEKHLGLNTEDYGTSFIWRDAMKSKEFGYTVWAPFDKDTSYFQPSTKEYMINFRVENLEELLEELQQGGVKITKAIEELPYGKFAHILDPEGNIIELWEPNDEEYKKIISKTTP